MNVRPKRQASCHPDRPHAAKDLCESCYNKTIKRKLFTARSKRATCHPERKHFAKGQCRPCYIKGWKRSEFRPAPCHPERPYFANDICKVCYRRNAMFNFSLGKKYGLTTAEYAALRQSSGDRCGICQEWLPETGGYKRLALDHDHRTGKIRGLLCVDCNKGLGFLKDDPWRLQQALAYLARAAEQIA